MIVNVNFEILKSFANHKFFQNQPGDSEVLDLPVSIVELIVKGGSGIRLKKIAFEFSYNFATPLINQANVLLPCKTYPNFVTKIP